MAPTWALYIHIPFCEHKCVYCDFYSVTQKELLNGFNQALLQEIDQYSHNPPHGGFSISTLYLGGGTPSLMTPAHLQQILDAVAKNFSLCSDAEITLEANPGAMEIRHLADFYRLGINRLSLGVQSFHDQELHQLSRIHTAADATQAIRAARQARFDNLSLDLIFAIPGQTLASWQSTLTQAIAFQPEHLSCYSLTIEAATPLGHAVQEGHVQPCDEELERELFILGQEKLQQAVYEHYEISNYCRPSFRSKHNQSYWQETPYLGLGPSAHSFDGHRRWWNIRDINRYLDALAQNQSVVAEAETLTPAQQMAESILLGLRRVEGVDLSLSHYLLPAITAMGGTDSQTQAFQPSANGKLFTLHDDRLALTREGLLIYNHICEKLCSQITSL